MFSWLKSVFIIEEEKDLCVDWAVCNVLVDIYVCLRFLRKPSKWKIKKRSKSASSWTLNTRATKNPKRWESLFVRFVYLFLKCFICKLLFLNYFWGGSKEFYEKTGSSVTYLGISHQNDCFLIDFFFLKPPLLYLQFIYWFFWQKAFQYNLNVTFFDSEARYSFQFPPKQIMLAPILRFI